MESSSEAHSHSRDPPPCVLDPRDDGVARRHARRPRLVRTTLASSRRTAVSAPSAPSEPMENCDANPTMPLAKESARTFDATGAEAGKYARSDSSSRPSSAPRVSS